MKNYTTRMLILCVLTMLCTTLVGQCRVGIHPNGVNGLGTNADCNDIPDQSGTIGGAPWSTLLNEPRLGNFLSFHFVNGPDPAGAMDCFTSLSITFDPIGAPLDCGTWHVQPDTTLLLTIPPGGDCYSAPWIQIPPLPFLVGFTFYSQSALRDPISNEWAVCEPIQITFLP